MDKLAAVNRVLVAVGWQRVLALDTAGNSLASEIERSIDAVSADLQSRGWHFNTRNNVELEPNGDDKIPVPAGVTEIDSAGRNRRLDLVIRDGFLFDLNGGDDGSGSDIFEDSILVTYVESLGWTSLPGPFQEYVIAEVAMEFNRSRVKNAQLDPVLARKAERARVEAKRHENRTTNINLLDTHEAARVRGRPRGGY